MTFSDKYPHLSDWIEDGGELQFSSPWEVLLVDEGGNLWNSGGIKSREEALAADDRWLAEEYGG
jgi:hypothetical protein